MTKTLKTKKAPNIKVPSTNGETFELKKIKNKYVVLYFYPKDDTPGCTIETCLLYTSPSPRDLSTSRMPSSA